MKKEKYEDKHTSVYLASVQLISCLMLQKQIIFTEELTFTNRKLIKGVTVESKDKLS